MKIIKLAEFLNVIAEPNRLKILYLLKSGPKCVCEIQRMLNLKQNLISHHLGVLREAGLIDFDKVCQWKHYFLNRKVIDVYKNIFNKILT